ncbi:hypothetical protein SLEP1_g52383 [Rubroshorea leprosula]|uniref:Uncharacterized protein n=1 Tax=Rubroshorea leprosula TaxID=152421 RepID=A0AAV5M9G8_9ROSI|nr:hypothetical protein SLEP1_g52383 [Rubroshorea leprosula]
MQSNYKSISKYINNCKWKSKEERKNKNQAFPTKLGSVETQQICWVSTNPTLAGREPSKAGFPPNPALLGSLKPRSAGFRRTQPWLVANPARLGTEPSLGWSTNPARAQCSRGGVGLVCRGGMIAGSGLRRVGVYDCRRSGRRVQVIWAQRAGLVQSKAGDGWRAT